MASESSAKRSMTCRMTCRTSGAATRRPAHAGARGRCAGAVRRRRGAGTSRALATHRPWSAATVGGRQGLGSGVHGTWIRQLRRYRRVRPAREDQAELDPRAGACRSRRPGRRRSSNAGSEGRARPRQLATGASSAPGLAAALVAGLETVDRRWRYATTTTTAAPLGPRDCPRSRQGAAASDQARRRNPQVEPAHLLVGASPRLWTSFGFSTEGRALTAP
jgi:hypothetical protein